MSDIQEQVLAALRTILGDPTRYGLTWRRLPATVVSASDLSAVTVILDGDDAANVVPVVSLIGGVALGDRVMVDIVPPSGAYIIGQSSVTGHRAYRYLETVSFTATTTVDPADYAGVVAVRQSMVGGGGGGGGSATTGVGTCASAGGGGGAGYSESFILLSDIGNSVDGWVVTVGTGGAGGAAGANVGVAGTNSSAGGYAAAAGNGGLQGTVGAGLSTSAGGQGGGASGNLRVGNGEDGGNGFRGGGIAQGTGTGGGSLWGGGRRSNTGNNGGAGSNGYVYGGGGSGSYLQASQTQVAGGNGANGLVVWDLFV